MSDFELQTIDYVLKGLARKKRSYIFLPDVQQISYALPAPSKNIEVKKEAIKPKPEIKRAPPEVKTPIKTEKPVPQEEPKKAPITLSPKTKVTAPEVAIKPVKGSPIDEMKDLRELLIQKYPKVAIYDTPLNDGKAKRIKNAWKDLLEVPNTLLIYSQGAHKPFMENIAKAISSVFTPAKALHISHFQDEENITRLLKDPNLKLIVTPDDAIMSSNSLMGLYKELPQQKQRFIGEIPLILLPDLSLYFKDPKLKASLWRLLCHQFSQKSA